MDKNYVARVHGTAWQDYPELCLSISVGKPAHEDTQLRAAVNFISKTGKPWIVDLSDTLQRHNLLGQPPDTAHAEARQRGDLWLERNHDIITTAPIAPTIIRWDHWLHDQRFSATHDAIRQAAAQDAGFASAIAGDVAKFSARGDGRHFAASIAFIWEECAALTLLGRDHACARVYPAQELQALQYLRVHAPQITPGYDRTGYTRFALESRAPRPGFGQKAAL